ncbi:MAG: hypothetical protein MUF87_07795 [Anaerolineae bacterium]|jgi:hypothetical protein|nr:hypothetical protein [Anaerolineae bacterium]
MSSLSIHNFAEAMRLLSQLYVETSSHEPSEDFIEETQGKILAIIDRETRDDGESAISVRFEDRQTGAIREITMTMTSSENEF